MLEKREQQEAAFQEATMQALHSIDQYLSRLEELKRNLPNQTSLAMLQGVQNRAKTARAEFFSDCQRHVGRLKELAE